MKKTQEELVDVFAQTMKDELKANEHKGDWRSWNNSVEIIVELDYHRAKLEKAMRNNNFSEIKEYLADSANFLLMLGNAYNLYD